MSRPHRLLLLLPLLLMLMAFRQSPLTNPDPIAIPAKVTQEQVAKAIKLALIHRGWSVTDDKPGEIDSTLHLRDHTARIAITFDDLRIQIKYVSSENLKYAIKDGKPYIHTNYLGWIENLVSDINGNLTMAAM